MASKIIILSGNGRGIARIYEMTHKIRLEMDAVVTEKNKRLGIMINDTVNTYPYAGRQIAIDLNPQKIHKASVIVYSDGNCLLSGSSNGKCDIPELMYLLSRYDAELERATADNETFEANISEATADNTDTEALNNANLDSGDMNKIDAEIAFEVENTANNAENLFKNESENNQTITVTANAQDINKVELNQVNNLRAESEIIESLDTAVIDGAKDINSQDFAVEAFTLPTEKVEKANGNVVSADSIALDDAALNDNKETQAKSAINKEHEVVTAMLEGKSEMNNESLPLGTVPFYEKIWHKIEEMFDIYQHDSVLEDLVYDSAWIRIPYEDDGYYVVGVISDDGKPVFICYGIPQDKMTRPDKEIEDSCEWLPIDKTDVSGKGYWLVYQDAMTGENIS